MHEQRPYPPWVNASVALACSITIVAMILVIGRIVDTLPHADYEFTRGRQLGDGFWWCLNGTFGTGCWAQ